MAFFANYDAFRLDSIGIAGFGHDFHSLDGLESPILGVFDAFGSNEAGFFAKIAILLSPVFPSLQHLPTDRNRMLQRFRETCGKIADELLRRTGEDELSGVKPEEKSILGLLSATFFSSSFLLIDSFLSQG